MADLLDADGLLTYLRQVERELDIVKQKAQELSTSGEGSFGKSAQAIQNFGQQAKVSNIHITQMNSLFGTMGKLLAGPLGLAGAVYGVSQALNTFATNTVHMENFAKSVDLSVGAVKEMQAAMRLGGLTTEQATQTLSTLGAKLLELREYGPQSSIWQAFAPSEGGITFVQRLREATTQAEKLNLIIKTYQAQQTTEEKDAFAKRLGVTREAIESMAENAERAKNLGLLSETDPRVREHFKTMVAIRELSSDAWERIGLAAFNAFKNITGGTEITDEKLKTWRDTAVKWVSGAIDTFAEDIKRGKAELEGYIALYDQWKQKLLDYKAEQEKKNEAVDQALADDRKRREEEATKKRLEGAQVEPGTTEEPATHGLWEWFMNRYRRNEERARQLDRERGELSGEQSQEKVGGGAADDKLDDLTSVQAESQKALVDIRDILERMEQGNIALGNRVGAVGQYFGATGGAGVGGVGGFGGGAGGTPGATQDFPVDQSGKPVDSETVSGLRQLAARGDTRGMQQFMASKGYRVDSAWCGDLARSLVGGSGYAPPQGFPIASNWRTWGQHMDPAGINEPGRPFGSMVMSKANVPVGSMGGHVMTPIPGTYDPESGTAMVVDTHGQVRRSVAGFEGRYAGDEAVKTAQERAMGVVGASGGITGPITDSYIAQERSKVMAQLQEPGMRELVASVLAHEQEGGEGRADVLEALVNRSVRTGTHPRNLIMNGFYGPWNRGAVQGMMRKGVPGYALKDFDYAMKRVGGGSDVLKGRDDQGEGGDTTIRGEGYGWLAGPKSREWARDRAERIAAAQRTAEAGADETTADEAQRTNINQSLSRMSGGTATRADIFGEFTVKDPNGILKSDFEGSGFSNLKISKGAPFQSSSSSGLVPGDQDYSQWVP